MTFVLHWCWIIGWLINNNKKSHRPTTASANQLSLVCTTLQICAYTFVKQLYSSDYIYLYIYIHLYLDLLSSISMVNDIPL